MCWLLELRKCLNQAGRYNPTPESVTFCGLPAALVVTFRVALGASVVGVKVTRFINWARRRVGCVACIRGINV